MFVQVVQLVFVRLKQLLNYIIVHNDWYVWRWLGCHVLM